MNAMILKSLLIIFVVLGISGCAQKVYVDRPVEVKVPVRIELPVVKCYPGKPTYTEEVKEMRLCIERYKEVMEAYNNGEI